MAIPGMFNQALPSMLNEQARNAIVREAMQQQAEGEGEGGEGSPSSILSDPTVQKGLALIVAAFIGGGISYVVFGRGG